MSIEMAGGVYCPLSPRDPQQRLQSLVHQTESRLILVHSLTQHRFTNSFLALNIDNIIKTNVMTNGDNVNVDQLSEVNIDGDSIAYVVFTSGSTGTPKGVSCSINILFSIT